MSRFHSHLNTAATVIESYQGAVPFAIFIKQFFAKEKKYGSKDRKAISALCYNYFRAGVVFDELDLPNKILTATFLCETERSKLLENIKPEWNDLIENSLEKKFAFLGKDLKSIEFFKLKQLISPEVDANAYSDSLVIQPDFHIRFRPDTAETVIAALNEANIRFEQITDYTLALQNGVKLPDELVADRDYVVQDASSQKVGEILYPYLDEFEDYSKLWDCCAASGGKSIMIYDMGLDFDLFVSDIRESILDNLTERFETAEIEEYIPFMADLMSPNLQTPYNPFDIIVLDVPCSGSGTWGRTPEQNVFFKEKDLKIYTDRQKKIADNVNAFLRPDGLLVYITCSVFKSENEDIVAEIKNLGYDELDSQYILGYNDKADSMFVSVLRKH